MRRWRSERGQELIEFVFASMLLLGLLLIILEGGITVWRYNMLATYAQDGARWAAVRGSTASPGFKSEGTIALVRAYVQAKYPGVSVNVDADPNTLGPGQTFTVTVTYPLPPAIGFFSMSGTMTAISQMQIQR